MVKVDNATYAMMRMSFGGDDDAVGEVPLFICSNHDDGENWV